MNIKEYLELGIVGALFAFAIYQYFQNQKNSKTLLNSNGDGLGKKILEELQTQNANHLHTIQGEINIGFDRLVDKQDECTNRLAQKLDLLIQGISKIEGKLNR